MSRGAKVTVKCVRCKTPFEARVADRKRGWGRFCSKSCKAIRQERRTGQYADYLERQDGGTRLFSGTPFADEGRGDL